MTGANFKVFDGNLQELADTVTSFCRGEYGEKCEFYQVSVERVRDGGSWKIHEFGNFDGDAARAVKNHLSAGDVVRVKFGGGESEIELIICPSDEPAPVSRFIDIGELEELGDESYIIVETGESESRLLDEVK